MSITRSKIRGKEMILIEGKVDGFYINPIKPEHIKTYAGKNGDWTPTHRYNLIVDGQAISLGMGDKDGVSPKQNIRAKDNEDNYHTLVKGLIVSVEVEELEPYNNKPQFRSGVGKVVIMDASGAEAAPTAPAPGAAPAEPYDETGMLVCHGINGAMALVGTGNFEVDNDTIFRLSNAVHAATTRLKEEVKKHNPDMTNKAVGNYSGNAVIAACRMVSADENLEDTLFDFGLDIVENVTLKFDEVIRSGKGAAKPAKRTAAPAKSTKPAGRKATKVVEEAQEPVTEDNDGGFDDMDDDQIPF